MTVGYDTLHTFFADYLQDIARGQTFVHTQRAVPVGTLLELSLEVPGTTPLALRARVFRVYPGAAVPPLAVDRARGLAVEFVFEDEGERRRAERRVEELLAEPLGSHHAGALLGRCAAG